MTKGTLQRWLREREDLQEHLARVKKAAAKATLLKNQAQADLDKLNDTIVTEVQGLGGVFEDTTRLVRVVYSKPAVHVTDKKLDLTKLDERFVRQTPSLKKDVVRIALEKGEDIKWAELKRTPYLQIEGNE